MKRLLVALFLLVLLKINAEDKFALVIGNSSYVKDPLSNTLNDANDVSEIFRSLGYDVTKIIDGNKQVMEMAISNVSERLTEDSMLVFYYAGHAAQVDKSNYLIPVKEIINDENDLKYKSVNLEWILGSFKSSRSRTNIVILDSCRDNPFKNSTRGGGTRGLTVIPSTPTGRDNFKNTAIIYATTDGNTADDGDGRNSPFTTAFLKHVTKENETILDVMLYVTQDVYTNSDGKQEPTMTNALKEKVYFKTMEQNIEPSYGSLLLSFKTDGQYFLDGEYIGDAKKGEDKLLSNLKTIPHILRFTTATETEELKVEVLKDTVIPVKFKLVNKEELKKEQLMELQQELSILNEASSKVLNDKKQVKEEISQLELNLKIHSVGTVNRDKDSNIFKTSLIVSGFSYISASLCGYYINENYSNYQSSVTVSDAILYRENTTNFIIATASSAILGLVSTYIAGSKYIKVKQFDSITNTINSELKIKSKLLSELIVKESNINNDIHDISLKIETLQGNSL